MQRKPTGTILYRHGKGGAADVVYAVAKWRDSTGRQQYRRLGPAWVERHAAGAWRKRRGRPPDGHLDLRVAHVALAKLIDSTEEAIGQAKTDAAATLADVAPQYLDYARHTQRLKPSTVREYERLLAAPTARKRHGGEHVARIMREFGGRPVAKITGTDVERFLRRLDRDGVSARNVNMHRQVLANVFEYAARPDSLALPANPVRSANKRREDYSKPPATFNAEQVMALARAATDGTHRRSGSAALADTELVEQRLADEQDAALYTVAGFAGLRQGELRALRWRHVRFDDRTLVVVAAMSAGVDTSTKSGKWRAVPMVREVFVGLDRLSQRTRFTGPDDYVFVGAGGGPLDESALRRRYARARDAAGLPPLPFHHLRHTFATLAIRGLDPATVQSLLGHSKITTTERYLHARPLTELAERMDAIFGESAPATVMESSRVVEGN
jgi:integrase